MSATGEASRGRQLLDLALQQLVDRHDPLQKDKKSLEAGICSVGADALGAALRNVVDSAV